MFNIYGCKKMKGYELLGTRPKEIAMLKYVRRLLNNENDYYKILVIEKSPKGDSVYDLYFKDEKKGVKKIKRRFN